MGRWYSGCPEALWDPTARPGPTPTNPHPPLKWAQTTHISVALTKCYTWDAHSCAYLVVSPQGEVLPKTPRLSKDKLGELQTRGFKVILGSRWADIDEPQHARLTDERWALYKQVFLDYPCILYRTRGGARIIQLLSRNLTPAEYEVSLRQWVAELSSLTKALGLEVGADPQCLDWTRLMRLPRVIRVDIVNGVKVTQSLHDSEVVCNQEAYVDPGDCKPPVKIVLKSSRPVISTAQDTRYGLKALREECDSIESAREGHRHKPIYVSGRRIGQLVAGGELIEATATASLEHAIQAFPEHQRALWDGYKQGLGEPRSNRHFDLDALREKFQHRLELDIHGNVIFEKE